MDFNHSSVMSWQMSGLNHSSVNMFGWFANCEQLVGCEQPEGSWHWWISIIYLSWVGRYLIQITQLWSCLSGLQLWTAICDHVWFTSVIMFGLQLWNRLWAVKKVDCEHVESVTHLKNFKKFVIKSSFGLFYFVSLTYFINNCINIWLCEPKEKRN